MPHLRRLAALVVEAVDRLVPVMLTAAGVTLVVAGMLTYLSPAQAVPLPSVEPTPTQTAIASRSPLPPPPSGSETFDGVVTRLVVPALNIDLPVIPSPANEEFPLCNTAEFLVLRDADGTPQRELGHPGRPQSTYLYAHARRGMFLPLLNASYKNNGQAMIGDVVEVYTSDDRLFLYEVVEVRRHTPFATTLNEPLAATSDTLWLQTSETTYQGPGDSSTKLLLRAQPIGHFTADHAQAHPKNSAVVCADAPRCRTAGGAGCRG